MQERGWGFLQAETSYICPQKEETIGKFIGILEVNENAVNYLKQVISKTGIPHVSFGDLIAINGRSISKDSRWLDEESRPLLFLAQNKLNTMLQEEPSVSARHYYYINVLFPKYMTSATFFLRFFQAGNGISCHLALTTLGPPIISKNTIEQNLIKHKFKEKNKELNFIFFAGDNVFIKALRKLEDWQNNEQYFQADIDLSDINNLEELDFDSIAILNCFENIGYDTSAYKDREGNYSINADKIDQLVVGERISIETQENEPSVERTEFGKNQIKEKPKKC